VSLLQHWQALDPATRTTAIGAARDRAGIPDLRDRDCWESRDRVATDAILAEVSAVAVRQEEAFDSLELSLAEAYPSGGLKRSATLDRSAQEIRIVDEWDEGVWVEEHFVIGGEPTAHSPGELLVKTLAGGLARLSWDPALGTGRLERRPVNDDLLERVWGPYIHRLIIDTDRTTFFELKFTRGLAHD
jgi:hypothetical protein